MLLSLHWPESESPAPSPTVLHDTGADKADRHAPGVVQSASTTNTDHDPCLSALPLAYVASPRGIKPKTEWRGQRQQESNSEEYFARKPRTIDYTTMRPGIALCDSPAFTQKGLI